MTRPSVTLAIRDYEFVTPLALGDVRAEGIDLTVVRSFDALGQALADPAVHGGEASFSRYVQRLAGGDRGLVGLPLFVMREFRHRNFYVRRGSPLRDVADLAGKRVGLDAWPNSGNTWSRALMRATGATVDRVRWVVGPVHAQDAAPPADSLPPGVERAPAGSSLRQMLVDGALDCLIWAWAPEGLYEPAGPIVRLYPDYRATERDYYRRTRIFPAHHLVVLRRELVDRHPEVMASVYQAFEASRAHSDRNRWQLHESSAWQLAELEEQATVLGADFRPYGYRENRAMIAAFCDEQLAQGLIRAPVDPEGLFADFEQLVGQR